MSLFSSFSRPGSAGNDSRKVVEESKESITFVSHPLISNIDQLFKQRAIYSELLIKSQQTLFTPTYTPLLRPASLSSNPLTLTPHPSPPADAFKGDHLPPLPTLSPAPAPHLLPPTLQPKVAVPYHHTNPTQPPRRIAIERKKRLYASLSLPFLLLPHRIDYSAHSPQHDHLTGLPSHLSLHLFDSDDFESYSPTHWLQHGPVPGQALRLDGQGRGDYAPCLIHTFHPTSALWEVEYTDTGMRGQLPRLHIHFAPEDPALYAARVVHAHTQRRAAEAALRASLSIDCMPIDDLTSMDSEQINRILFLTLNTKHSKLHTSDTSTLISELHLDYARTLNSITFYSHQPAPLTPPPPPCTPSATVRIPSHDFAGHFTGFCFHSFLCKAEAISALMRVQAECLKVRGQSLFVVGYGKSVRVEEFVSGQHSAMHSLSSSLHDKLLVNVTTAIKQALKDVDKGWLNLHERSRDIYEYSKLHKFMTRVNFAIGDCVRSAVHTSVNAYTRMIERTCQYDVQVGGMKDVTLTPKADLSAQPATDALPLFTVDLLFKDLAIQYSTPPSVLASCALEVFDAAFASLSRLPQVESSCLPQLFPINNVSYLSAVQREEPDIERLYERLKDMLEAAAQPLLAYLALYEVHLPFLLLNVDDHIKELQRTGQDSLESIKQSVQSYLDRRAEVELAIPKQVNLGLTLVNCEDVRRKVLNKYTEMSTKLLELLQRIARSRCEEVTKAVKRVEVDVKRTPIDIVELTKLREYLLTVPSTINAFKASIYNEVMASFDLLDHFHCKVPKDLLKLKWTVYAYPKSLQEMVAQREGQLQADSSLFLQEMRGQQEELNSEINDVEKRINALSHLHDFDALDKVNERCEAAHLAISAIQAKARQYNSNEQLFPATSSTDYTIVTTLTKRFDDYYLLFTTAHQWAKSSAAWRFGSFLELNGEAIQAQVDLYSKNLTKVLKAKAIKDNTAHFNLASNCKRELDQFKAVLPLILALRNPGMKERHWKLLSDKLPYNFSFMMKDLTADPDSNSSSSSPSLTPGLSSGPVTLHKLVEEMGLQSSVEMISKVSDVASKEFAIEQSLQRMEDAWKAKEFTVQPYKATGTFVVKDVDELIGLLDEHIMTTQSMQFSPYKRVFEERINRWIAKLNVVSEVIEEWLAVQKSWLNLQSIFSSPDINKQLPVEGKRFTAVNKSWRLIMSQVHATPDVLSFADSPALLSKLKESNLTLTAVQKKLSDYLDKKRSLFPRFYFLANEELLAILSQTTDPLAVQPHLKKCFENVDQLEFQQGGEAGTLIVAMKSGEGERVEFVRPISVRDRSVEDWLSEVESAMKATVRHWMNDAIGDYSARSRADWVREWPGQCVLNGSQYHWTMEMEKALREQGHAGLLAYAAKWKAQLGDMVELVRGELTKLQRLTLGALIVLDVHARDVHDRLMGESVKSVDDFGWICQMRYYLQDDDLFVQMVQAKLPYGCEYLGNTLRLVITPLTDRCYLTLMSAMSLHLGGAPSGPAGTGKTETVKDLAKAVAKSTSLTSIHSWHADHLPHIAPYAPLTLTACLLVCVGGCVVRYCVVFNCSDGLNYQAMGKFFKGLASSGAWACFDEFNRIDIEVLSVVAQQIMTIWAAVREQAPHFVFEGTDIRLDPTVSVFITMNPGYAGRTELPDNLECLFRPVAMMVPDYALIAEIMLYSFGFHAAQPLARKMVATFKLCSEQLSSQDHYDYGMRAVKTVITRAGILKAAYPTQNEELLLLQALKDVNVPKFLKQDLPLFDGIISDLFPGLSGKDERDVRALREALTSACAAKALQPVDAFLDKCIQLYDTTVVRHGVMLVGPAGGGKTTNLHTLAAAMTALSTTSPQYQRVVMHTLNPKSITQDQLYGGVDKATMEWQDGILAGIVRECIADTSPAKKWVVFDGPVDAVWIENMNTVLDDNKKLCLVSGEILTLTPTMTMVFEVEDLSVASPATVSRCGMVYMDGAVLGVQPLLTSFLSTLHSSLSEFHDPLHTFFAHVQPALTFVRKQCMEPVVSCDNNLVRSFLNIVDALLRPFIPSEGNPVSTGDDSALPGAIAHTDCLCLLAMVWSIGGAIDQPSRVKFSQYLRTSLPSLSDPVPADGSVYDYRYSLQAGRWCLWMDTVPAYKCDDKLTYNELIVPTKDSVRSTFFLDVLTRAHHHVLFTGGTGTGKTVNIQQFFSRLDSAFLPVNVIFSAATTANQLDDLLLSKMSKRRQRVYGPPLGQHFVIFIDDLNMPTKEKYGAQPPLELVRQFMDHQGWYDRKTLAFTDIVDVQIVSAMAPPGGGRNVITGRLLRHFNQVAHVEMDRSTLYAIFSVIVDNSLAKFPEEVRSMSHTLVHATLDVYTTITQSLLPTPNKSHYTFNLRDLSAVFQGMLSASSRKVTAVPSFLRLWNHENRRVFKDRLVSAEDRQWCDDLLASTLTKHFSVEWSDIAPDSSCLLFGNYLEGRGAEHRQYEEVVDLDVAKKVMEEALQDYGDEHTPMKLTLFNDCIEHVSRIARILRQPGGNALLLGVGGSGRQSLTRLACFMSEYSLFQVEMSKAYGVTEWRDDMRKLLLDAGLKEQSTVFLVTDTQITAEVYYNDLNAILNCQEIPNLYSPEDLDTIFATCKADCQRKGLALTKVNAYNQFLLRVKANLHIVLCMSPASSQFRTRLRMYPALVNCCTIDWFSDWPEQALTSVAESSLNDEELKLDFTQRSAIVSMMMTVHTSVAQRSQRYKEELRRYNYVTPTSYLELLSVFKSLLHEKRSEIGGKRAKLQNGLNKLESASKDIAQLQVDLTEKQPKLVETQKEVETTMLAIDVDKRDAAVTKEAVEQQSEEAEKKAAECKAMRDEAQKELDKALPLLDKAVECLSELNKTHIDEVRNFKKPPPAVVLTMEAACIMLRHVLKLKISTKAGPDPSKPKVNDYWETAQKFLLKQPKVLLDTLKTYDKENIPEEVLSKIRPYIEREDFQVKNVEKASLACRAICMWVHAMYQFSLVNAEVEPLRLKLKAAESELETVMVRLNDAKERMRQVEERLQSLEAKYNALVEESESLRVGVEQCQVKLQRAEKLISGLGGEKDRWIQSVASLSSSYDCIIGDVLIAASTIAYLGAFTSDYRQAMIEQWRGVLKQLDVQHSDSPSILHTLGDPVQIRAWNIAGLPTDAVSIENGIIMAKARRWPLMIDPQGQASKFIRKLGLQRFEEGMAVVKLTDKGFLSTFENAVRFGKWVLLEDVGEELDPALEPLLLQQMLMIKGQAHIKLGESTIPYNDQFHLYITTKLPNPHYAPELQVKVTLLNFTITPSGLTDQMLGTVVAKEQPELESKKNSLTVSNARMKKQLADTEDAILRMLNEASGDILDDSSLIDTLAQSKKTSAEITERVNEAEVIEREIDDARRAYVCVAERASLLYFCIADLSSIDPMYQYSLAWFVQLFIAAIANAPPSSVEDGQSPMDARLDSLNAYFTHSLYTNVSRSLFEPHKLLFSFLLTLRILQRAGRINDREYRFLVAGPSGLPSRAAPNPAPSAVTDDTWQAILGLSELEAFLGFDEAFSANPQALQGYCDAVDPYSHPLPDAFEGKLSDFQRLLVLRCVRADKLTGALSQFVARHQGREFIESPPFSFAQTYGDSNSTTPIIFILSRGADPTTKLMQYAADAGYRDKTVSISLGQGQGPIAERHIADGMRRGGWVVLQNCHLALSWLPTLERLLAELKPEDIHADFRLWITSMPSSAFPVSILQNGVKVTNEPPKGLRANLLRSYHSLGESDVNATLKVVAYKKLLYALCFFHAVLLERKRYGSLGFNIPYFFNETDLGVCVSQLREFIDRYDDVPYQVIHFLTYDINYGGRVTDDIDRRCVATILDDFINPRIMADDYLFAPSPLARSLPALEGSAEYIAAIAGHGRVRTLPRCSASTPTPTSSARSRRRWA